MIFKFFENDYSLNLINKIHTIFMGLISSIFMTRYLGVVLRGEYSFITQLTSVASIILSIGIHQSYSYFYKKNGGKIFKKYSDLYFLLFIIYTILSIFLVFWVKNKMYIYSIVLIPSSVINLQMEATMAVENIRLKIKLHMLSVTIRAISFILMYLFLSQSLLTPVILTIILNLMTVIIYFYNIKIIPNIDKIDFNFSKQVINYSWLPMITSLLVTLNYSIDVFILKYMETPYVLGLYSTALSIINYIWLVPDAFKEVLISRVSRSDSERPTVDAAKISFYTVIVIILVFILFGQFAITLLYGTEFEESYLVTVILSFGALSMVFYKIIGVQLLAEGKRVFYFMSLLLSVILNIILNLIFIPLLGMYGAAIASVFSYTICGLMFLVYFTKYKNISVRNFFIITKNELNRFKKL